MTREEAFKAMQEGKCISHRYFTHDEYYEMKNNKIIAEDNVNHTNTFWSTVDNDWRKDGWYIKE